jgi:hypothetical protein
MALLSHIPLRLTAGHHAVRLPWWSWLAVAAWLCLHAPTASAQELTAPEYQVKAAFLYNFTKLVTWPTNAFANHQTPLVVGVLGQDPFGDALEKTLTNRVVNGHPLGTAHFTDIAQVTNCHVLFINEPERAKLDRIFETLRPQPLLTVSDAPELANRVMITLVKPRDTLELRINLAAASTAHLQFSSRLTRLDKTLRPLTDHSTNAPTGAPN